MPVHIPDLLIECAAAFGIGVLLYEFTKPRVKTIVNFHFEDKGNKENKGKKEAVSSGDFSEEDSSYIYAIDEEGEGNSDDKRRLVIRTLKVQKKK